MDLPTFDGRTPLTKEVMNEIVRRTRANDRLFTTPGMEVLDLGSLGKIVTLANPTTTTTTPEEPDPEPEPDPTGEPANPAYTGSGFWARIYIAPAGEDDPENAPPDPPDEKPYAYMVEQMLGNVPATSTQPAGVGIIDKPNGRKAYLAEFNYLFQHIASLSSATINRAVCLTLANFTAGTFTVTLTVHSFAGANLGNFTTPPIAWPATRATLQTAFDALPAIAGVAGWHLSLVAKGETPASAGEGLAFNVVLTPTNPAAPPDFSVAFDTTEMTPPVGPTSAAFSYVTTPTNTRLLNVNPHGQLVFVQRASDPDGVHRYLFDLPYVGMWGRITGGPEGGSNPPAYPFLEQQPAGSPLGTFLDYTSGESGFAYEINGEPGVAVNSIVWLVPLFITGHGFVWIFQAPNDVRFLQYTGGNVAPNCLIVAGRTSDAAGYASTPGVEVLGYMKNPDGTAGSYVINGFYLGQRAGVTNGYATFLAPDTLGAGGWSGTFPNQTGTVTVESGRITNIT